MEDNIKNIQKKAKTAKISELFAESFMTKPVIAAHVGDSIRSVIDMFKRHKISGAPVLSDENSLKGIVTEYDLLLQAATKDLDSPIEFISDVTSVKVDTLLKEIIVIIYKKRLKRIPVLGACNTVVGIISRIDVLSKLALLENKEEEN